jgi:hypothetical protein
VVKSVRKSKEENIGDVRKSARNQWSYEKKERWDNICKEIKGVRRKFEMGENL